MWDVTGCLGVRLRSESSFWDVLAQSCLHLGLYSDLFPPSIWGVTTWEFQILTLSANTAREIQVRYKELLPKRMYSTPSARGLDEMVLRGENLKPPLRQGSAS